MGRPVIVPLSLAEVAGPLLLSGDPPEPGVRRYVIARGCPCCEPDFEPLPEIGHERTSEVIRRMNAGEATEPWELIGDLTLVAVPAGTRLTCSRCDLDGYEEQEAESAGDALSDLIAQGVAEPHNPLETLPGVPFMPVGADAILAGSGNSRLAQAIGSHITGAGLRVLFIGDGPEGAACVAPGALLPRIVKDPTEWLYASRSYDLIVTDLAAAAGVLGLNVGRHPEHWQKLHRALVKPCEGTVLMVGDGLPARRREAAITLAIHPRRTSSVCVEVICERSELIGGPFGVGDRWIVDCSDGGFNVVSGDAVEPDREALPDLRAIVVHALENDSPQGKLRLERALRAAGIKIRSRTARRLFKALVEDPDCPVFHVEGQGYALKAAGGSRGGSQVGPKVGPAVSQAGPPTVAGATKWVPDLGPGPTHTHQEGALGHARTREANGNTGNVRSLLDFIRAENRGRRHG